MGKTSERGKKTGARVSVRNTRGAGKGTPARTLLFWISTDFRRSKWKKTWSVFGAKMVTKSPIIRTIDQGPISKLYPLLTPNFLQAIERIWSVEDSENKRAKRSCRKGKGRGKNCVQILAYAHVPNYIIEH